MFVTDRFNREVQELVDKSGVMDMEFRYACRVKEEACNRWLVQRVNPVCSASAGLRALGSICPLPCLPLVLRGPGLRFPSRALVPTLGLAL